MFTVETSFKRVQSLTFSADGRLAVLSKGNAWECEVWSLPPDPETVWRERDDEPFAFGLAFDPRTGHLMHGDSGDGLIASEPSSAGAVGWEVPGGPLRVFAISPSGDRIVCGCEFVDGRLPNRGVDAQLVSFTRGGKQKHWTRSAVLESDGFGVTDLAFFPNGKRFASIEWSKRKVRKYYLPGDSPTLRVHDAKSLDELDATTFKQPASALVVCGNKVVVRGEKSFRVWDGDDLSTAPTEVKTGKAPGAAVVADPQGRFVLTATSNAVSVWDANSWSATKTYEWASGKISCLAVSPDGLLAAAGTATGKVIVWDVE
ncbi:---NA--- : Vegetative incompatibility WD repeat protein, putative OS=Aspergillus flavus (strain ATCC 200026 / FGSC A1120 / NRRL 3357 / JCM 12722 / SRRC 167) GN=AFLA_124690 PE=4 SV=1: WD40 [Gemmataceae bacterium]|nr:---NA--- : Vegetative incompatibility WD repeat protein, putative OS=Aspergillus flavus (strain ATCC 200026 / FGSC A1120 / NRRL 3357 / JCM 12722 / SRRC 167) GN=AFLA_124690 PE=4 SV=1: WD40 [Gemmataceae bacterium]VTU02134.1 ---NA--- : Vegetative incompatibility WD repeat protein, putative OS=Aspergillus flavus (strain ATCC 200026 / FGSC A1120 / NRRL 3357 / JCM 12722 / SRRC 167) GN=AFLA_124690 PE=4 SV=1: WD40 [Gemmataceae bacterium]